MSLTVDLTHMLKKGNPLSKFLTKCKAETSRIAKLCLEVIRNINSIMNTSWLTDEVKKEEGLSIKDLVDTLIIDPLFTSYSDNIIKHGSEHTLKSGYRKIKQAVKNDNTMKDWKGRAPDRSLEVKSNEGA